MKTSMTRDDTSAGCQDTAEKPRNSESKFRRLHQSMVDGFASVYMQGRIVESNESFRQMLGYSPEELARLTYVDLTPPRWHAFEQRIIQEQVLPK